MEYYETKGIFARLHDFLTKKLLNYKNLLSPKTYFQLIEIQKGLETTVCPTKNDPSFKNIYQQIDLYQNYESNSVLFIW